MNSNEFLTIKARLPELRKQLIVSPHGQIPRSVEYLEKAIGKATSLDDKIALYSLLLSECSRCRNYELEVHFLRQRLRDWDNDPFPLTSLATALAREQSTRDEALQLAAQAVSLAKKQDRQVKYSLTCQARVALEVGDYAVFNDALRRLIEDANNHRAEDHGLEFDFLDHIDPNQVDNEIMSQYRALR